MPLSDAERLLKSYGVADPKHVDLEALAFDLGAYVKYDTIEGCEARILGVGDRAIITIDDSSGRRRGRFSLGHEIGHWRRHRGQPLLCAKESIGGSGGGKPKEREADRYAADLLMPSYLFLPRARSFEAPSFRSIDELVEEFDVSRQACAKRFVAMDVAPCVLICHGQHGRRWFDPSKSWNARWFPIAETPLNTDAFDLIFNQKPEPKRRELTPADVWFDQPDAGRFEVWAHTALTGSPRPGEPRETLTLIIPKDVEMMEDRAYSRRW